MRLQGGGWTKGAQVCSRFGGTLEGLEHEWGSLGSTPMQRDPGEAGGDGKSAGQPLEKAWDAESGEVVESRRKGRREWMP